MLSSAPLRLTLTPSLKSDSRIKPIPHGVRKSARPLGRSNHTPILLDLDQSFSGHLVSPAGIVVEHLDSDRLGRERLFVGVEDALREEGIAPDGVVED